MNLSISETISEDILYEIALYLDCVIQVSSSLFLTDIGQVYICGKNESGAFGLGDYESRDEQHLSTILK
jgi:hypothetical protein